MGWYMLPLAPGGKRPLINDWPNKATRDRETIRKWAALWPDANVGIACKASGLVVIDIDVKNGVNGFAAWAALLSGVSLKEVASVAA